MTDKEKLVELLKQVDACICDLCGEDGTLERVSGVIADHLLASGVTIQKWIPVSERLPEPRKPVLVHFRNGMVSGEAYLPCLQQFTCEGLFGPATHWMPMPTPPKGE